MPDLGILPETGRSNGREIIPTVLPWEIGANIHASERIGKPATYNSVSVKLGNNCCHLQMRSGYVRGIYRAVLTSQRRKKTWACVAVARVHRVQTGPPLKFLEGDVLDPIPNNWIRRFLPPSYLEEEFIPSSSLARPFDAPDRSIKIFHGINVIRYVNKRRRLRTYLVQLNDQRRIQGGSKIIAEKFLAKVSRKFDRFFFSFVSYV